MTRAIGALLFALVTLNATSLSAQQQYVFPDIPFGSQQIGFAPVEFQDSTRVTTTGQPRRIRGGVWYPVTTSGKVLRFEHYVHAFQQLGLSPSEGVARFRTGFLPAAASADVDRLLQTAMRATAGGRPGTTRHPLLLYAPGLGGSPLTHVLTCEFLASQGFVVAAINTAGNDELGQTFDVEGQQALLRDLSVAAVRLQRRADVRPNAIGVIGFSFGANAALLLAMQRPDVRAVVSLDGAIAFVNGTPMLRADPGLQPLAMQAPLLRLESAPDPYQDSSVVRSLLASRQTVVGFQGADHHDFLSRNLLLNVATGEITPEERARYRLTLDLLQHFLRPVFLGAQAPTADSLAATWPAAQASVVIRPALSKAYTRVELTAILRADSTMNRFRSLQQQAGPVPLLSSVALQLTASTEEDAGHLARANTILGIAEDIYPGDADIPAARASVLMLQGDTLQACQALQRSLAHDSNNVYARDSRSNWGRRCPAL